MFLSELWDQFNHRIGHVGCVHYYTPTENSELYEYKIHWSDSELDFLAEIVFINHTAKGLVHVRFAAICRESNERHDNAEELICISIKAALEADLQRAAAPVSYVCIPFVTYRKLSGHYKLPRAQALILKVGDSESYTGHLFLPVFSKNKTEMEYEGLDRAVKFCAALTTLTQNLCTVDRESKWYILECDEYEAVWADHENTGAFADDSGFLRERETSYVNPIAHEIIEENDCVQGNLLIFPFNTDAVLSNILQNDAFVQSCSRFAEALYIRRLINTTPLALQLISYEIIAYAASIEALLDSRKATKEVVCGNCLSVVFKEDWKIVEKYKALVIGIAGDDDLYKRFFKPLYDDRSKFVHTGFSLYNLHAVRPGRPMPIMGKKALTRAPGYYNNVHELGGWLLRKYFYMQSQHLIIIDM